MRAASDVFVYLAGRIENAVASDVALFGAVMDMTKAFNLLPREPVTYGMQRLGLSAGFVNAWRSYLDGVQRACRTARLISESFTSTNGFPEAFCLAVAAMIVVGWTFKDEMDATAQVFGHEKQLESAISSDILEVITSSADVIPEVVNSADTWAKDLQVDINMSKSWWWGANPGIPVEIQEVGREGSRG